MPGIPEIYLICNTLLGTPIHGLILMMMMALAGKFIPATVNFSSPLRYICSQFHILPQFYIIS